MVDLKLNMWLASTKITEPIRVGVFEVTTIQNEFDSDAIERVSDSVTYTSRGISIAAAITGFGYPAIAVVSAHPLPRILATTDTPRHRMEIRDASFALNLEQESHRRVLGSIVNKAVLSHLRGHLGSELWQRSQKNRVFCLTIPEVIPSYAGTQDKLEFDLFRGFRYRIDVFPDGRLGLSLDMHSTVLDRLALADRIRLSGIDAFPVYFKNQYFVLATPDRKLKVRFVKKLIVGETIDGFSKPNHYGGSKTVFEMYDGVHPRTRAPLEKSDHVIQFSTYSEGKEDDYAPASCFYDILSNEELEEEPDLKKMLMIPADERFRGIASYRKQFIGTFDKLIPGRTLGFRQNVCDSSDFKSGVFELPGLRFGNDGLLDPAKMINPKNWRTAKETSLKEYGWFRPSAIGEMLAVYPKGCEQLFASFYHDLTETAVQWNEKLPSKYVPLETSDYLDILPNIENHQARFHAAIVIMKEWDEEAYRRIKGTLKIPSQFALLRTIERRRKGLDRREDAHYHSVLENITSGILGKSGAIPWVMAAPLSCDCYLGVDSGGSESRIWSYAYVFDSTGASIGSERGQAFQNESIEKGRFKNSIIQALSSYPKRPGSGKGPCHITIHRDGRLTRTEKEGLLEALKMLEANGQLEQMPSVAVVDVKKNHPLRLFERGQGGFRNPFIGSFFILDDHRAVINTTGAPVLSEQGTAAPLLLEMETIFGKSDIQDVARDLFYLSELNWGSPKMDTKMPITIRFAEKRIFYADKGIEYADQFPL